jgi:hypothetical protein
LIFYYGREHKVFIDNHTIEVQGSSFRALKLVRVAINNAEPIELTPRQRDLVKVAGPSFKFRVEVMDEFGENVEKTIERELNPGFEKDMMLSLPLLASERSDYILPPPVYTPPTERETAAGDEESLFPKEENDIK